MALARICARHQVDAAVVSRLERLKIISMKQLFLKCDIDMAVELDMSFADYQALLKKMSKVLAPPTQTAYQLLKASQIDPNFLATEIKALDLALLGGVPHGSITEVAGVAGVGKSQFCMMMSVNTTLQYKEGSVIYIDTERKFSQKRLLQIANARMLSSLGKSQEKNLQDILSRIHVATAKSAMELLSRIQKLEDLIAESNVRLIVIDSIASLVRKDFGPDEIPQRQELLTRKASLLKYYAGTYGIPVITTNQASRSSTHSICPTLGNTWSHSVNTRIQMESTIETQGRLLRIVKSPVAPEIVIPFEIKDDGLVEIRNYDSENRMNSNNSSSNSL